MAIGVLAGALAVQSSAISHAQESRQSPPATTPPAAVPAPKPEPFAVAAPTRARGGTVARIVAPTIARRRIAERKRGWRLNTETSSRARRRRCWCSTPQPAIGGTGVKLLLPVRPNGAAAWVPRDRVAVGRSRYWIEVRTAVGRVTVFRDGRRVRRMRAVVGTSGTPTPHGLAAIYEINRQPDPRAFLGPRVLSLTAHSNVLQSFGGGPGRVGIHGRSGASLQDPLGSAASHGCIRIDNHQISWMAYHIPAGTPVRVRP